MPVVAQAGFEEEVLAGEAEILLHRAGDADGLAEGIIGRSPDGGAGRVRQPQRAAQMVGVDHQQRGRWRVHPGDEAQGQRRGLGALLIVVVGGGGDIIHREPDIVPQRGTRGAVRLRQKFAIEAVDVMHLAGRAARRIGGTLHHLLLRVEGIARRLGGAGAGAGDGDGAVAEIVGEAQRLSPITRQGVENRTWWRTSVTCLPAPNALLTSAGGALCLPRIPVLLDHLSAISARRDHNPS